MCKCGTWDGPGHTADCVEPMRRLQDRDIRFRDILRKRGDRAAAILMTNRITLRSIAIAEVLFK